MKAREFLAQAVGERLKVRNLLKEKLSVSELRALAKLAGGPAGLVAPKKRTEAAGLAGDALIEWLAEDGARVRRPIVVTGKTITLGFAGDAKAALVAALAATPAAKLD